MDAGLSTYAVAASGAGPRRSGMAAIATSRSMPCASDSCSASPIFTAWAGFTRWPFWRRWFGSRSEKAAARFLRRLGYRVLAANLNETAGEIDLLVVSKVANFSIDLPGAEVAIQVSGSFGSRQEEAQRLGRLLRPKESGLPANFYTLVARDTVDQDFAQNRQRFLAEQGYSYTILDADSLDVAA